MIVSIWAPTVNLTYPLLCTYNLFHAGRLKGVVGALLCCSFAPFAVLHVACTKDAPSIESRSPATIAQELEPSPYTTAYHASFDLACNIQIQMVNT